MLPSSPPLPPSPRRWPALFIWGGLIFLLIIVGVVLMKRQQGTLAIGKPAPGFELTSYDGEPVSLESLRGKVVVVNFWASWCVPCEEEADELEQAWQYYQNRDDVVFLGIAWSDMDTKAKQYIAEYKITYLNAPDMGTRASQAYRITGVPETYIIGPDGVLAYAKFSPFTSVAEIQAAIEPLLQK
jgi:cytochrome c biogenesis protein CcmG, thiol:disulfide interchange protein DsbE